MIPQFLINAGLYIAGHQINKWLTDKPKKKKLSPVYKVREDELRISHESALPIAYGYNKIKGQNIYREDTIASLYDLAVAFCEGEVEEIEDIRINDIPINKLASAITYTAYRGTATQIGDNIFKKGVFNLAPSDDCYVSSNYPDWNPYWTNTGVPIKMIYEKKVGGVEKNRAYMRYDLSEIPGNITIDSAELKALVRYTYTDATVGVWAGATATDWAEETITWNNKPADIGGVSLELQYLSINDKIETFPLNATGVTYLTTQHQADSFVSFFFLGTGSDSYTAFANRASEFFSPTLVLHYSGGESCGFRHTAYLSSNIDTSVDAFKQLPDPFNPEFVAYIKGRKIKVWDAVNSDWNVEYSTNPAWQIADLLENNRLALDIDVAYLDLDSFKTVAAYCDALILNLEGKYEKRFECNIVIDDLDNVKTYLEDILTTFGGFLYSKDGKIHLGIEKAESVDADFALDTDNIIAGSFSYSQIPKDKIPNVVKILYTDPEKDFRKVYLRVDDEVDIAERGEVIKEIPCYGINRRSQASRIANHILWKGRLAGYTFKCRVSINQCHAIVGELCEVTHPIPNWTSKKFRIVSMEEYPNEEIEIIGEEYVSSLYGDEGIVQGYDEVPVIEDWADLPAVTGLTLTETYRMTDDGTYQPQINVAFTIPDYVLGKDKLEFYVWWRATGDAYSLANHVHATGSPIKIDVPGADTYYVRVQTFVYQPWDIIMPPADAPEDSIAITGLGLGVIPEPHGFVWSYAGGKAAWTTGIVTYKGVKYEINSGATAAPYIYFDRNESITDFQSSVTTPAASIDMFVMAYCDTVTGSVEQALSGKIMHAGLLQADTVRAREISVSTLSAICAFAGTITAGHFQSATSGKRAVIDGTDMKFSLYNTSGTEVVVIDDAVPLFGNIPFMFLGGPGGAGIWLYDNDVANKRVTIAEDGILINREDQAAAPLQIYYQDGLVFSVDHDGDTFIKKDLNLDGEADIAGNLDVHAGLDVTGTITVTGLVDTIDIANHIHDASAGHGNKITHANILGVGINDHHDRNHDNTYHTTNYTPLATYNTHAANDFAHIRDLGDLDNVSEVGVGDGDVIEYDSGLEWVCVPH